MNMRANVVPSPYVHWLKNNISRIIPPVGYPAILPNDVGYPRINVEAVNDNCFVVTYALAGWKIEDLDISVKTKNDRVLIVKGKKVEDNKTYLHKGIASRSFEHSLVLDRYLEVKSADLENGLLSITLERKIPEHELPKKIEINVK